MKKMLRSLLCLTLLTTPLQTFAVTQLELNDRALSAVAEATTETTSELTNDSEVPTTTEDSTEAEGGNSPTSSLATEPVKAEGDPTDTSTITVTENKEEPEQAQSLARRPFNKEEIKNYVKKELEAALPRSKIISLTEAIDELLLELAELLEVSVAELEIGPAERMELGRLFLNELTNTADQLLGEKQAAYTLDSIRKVKEAVSAARATLSRDDVSFTQLAHHFTAIQQLISELTVKEGYTVDPSGLANLVSEIRGAKLNPKKYLEITFDRLDALMEAAIEMIGLLATGEVFTQKELDTLEQQLSLAYSSLLLKQVNNKDPLETLKLVISAQGDSFPVLAEKQGAEVSVRIYGDTDNFQPVKSYRLELLRNGHSLYEDTIYQGEPFTISKDEINSLIVDFKLSAIGDDVFIPADLVAVTKGVSVTVSDQRRIPTEKIIIPSNNLAEPIILSGGIYGTNGLVIQYDEEEEGVNLSLFTDGLALAALGVSEEMEASSSYWVELGEPVLVWLGQSSRNNFVELIVELEAEKSVPSPPTDLKPPAKEKSKLPPTHNLPKNLSSPMKPLPNTGEVTNLSLFLTVSGYGLLVFSVFKYRSQKKNRHMLG